MTKGTEPTIRGKTAIVGIGQSKKVGRVPGVSPLALAAEAANAALADAGMEKTEIDAVISTHAMSTSFHRFSVAFSEYWGIVPTYSNNVQVSGATGAATLNEAAAAINAGYAKNVLVVIGDSLLTGMTPDMALRSMTESRDQQYEMPFGIPVANTFAMTAHRHMKEYGTTREHFAHVAVTQRKHAIATPGAQMTEEITIDDVLNSKVVTTPYHKLDCALISDGGAAFIITSAERAKDCPKKPIYLLGAGECFTHEHIFLMPDITTTGGVTSSRLAYKMAGVKPSDFDVAGIYDCFTGTVVMMVEDLGFCKKGEGGPFIADGNMTYGGAIPANTHGGLLSYAHIGNGGSYFHAQEVVRQLRGECGPRQVKGAELGLYHALGAGFACAGTTVLGTEATL